jgi:hypothetical protein
LFKIFRLVWWWVCIHCFDCFLVSTFTKETQVSPPVTRTTWSRISSPSLWYRCKKSKPKPFSVFYFFVSQFIIHNLQNLQ